jgi:hypothetical protein
MGIPHMAAEQDENAEPIADVEDSAVTTDQPEQSEGTAGDMISGTEVDEDQKQMHRDH